MTYRKMYLMKKKLDKKDKKMDRLNADIQRKKVEHKRLCFEYSDLNELYKKYVQEQQQDQSIKYYCKAVTYMYNAEKQLKKAKHDTGRYQDYKTVKKASKKAYKGVLFALESFLVSKGIEAPNKKTRKSDEYYRDYLGQINEELLETFIRAHRVLYLYRHYDELDIVCIVKSSFEDAQDIIDKIKPTSIKGINGNTIETID